MTYYSTRNHDYKVGLETALFRSLAPDQGLYMPQGIPVLEPGFLDHLDDFSFSEICLKVGSALIGPEIPRGDLQRILYEAIDFPAPLVRLDEQLFVLELFRGPSGAFKDFGARFMSRLMAYFLQRRRRQIQILVATSGDTGGAVALGFFGVPGIRVTILYPSGKVSPVQERQMTTLGGNIRTIELNGTFDDCQQLVKEAFSDPELNQSQDLASANSINIARLIPQTFYYFEALAQLRRSGVRGPVCFSVPSGNFGNLTAGVLAARMGLDIERFLASTNINDEVPRYLSTGIFEPAPSRTTLSSAMDVGNPSNFERLQDLFGGRADTMGRMISASSFTDEQTLEAIGDLFTRYGYIPCPHTAIAYLGIRDYLARQKVPGLRGVFVSTAHPGKFPDVFPAKIREQIPALPLIRDLDGRAPISLWMENDFLTFKTLLLEDSPRSASNI